MVSKVYSQGVTDIDAAKTCIVDRRSAATQRCKSDVDFKRSRDDEQGEFQVHP